MTDDSSFLQQIRKELLRDFESGRDSSKELLLKAAEHDAFSTWMEVRRAPEIFVWLLHQFGNPWVGSNGNGDARFRPPRSLQKLIVDGQLDMLQRIEDGELRIEMEGDLGVGPIPFSVSNGWKIHIWSRMFEWDHVEWFTTPEGIDTEEDWLDRDLQDRLLDYAPPESVIRNVYKFDRST